VSFQHPWLLFLLLLAPLRSRRVLALGASAPADGSGPRPPAVVVVPGALALVAVVSAVLAAAGPGTGAVRLPDMRHARSIVLAMDTSESMLAEDLGTAEQPLSRMDCTLSVAREFIEAREGDRLGVVVFGSRAVTQCPLTLDRRVALSLLAHVSAEMLGKRTALGDGVALGAARAGPGGAVVVVSDGQETAGEVSLAEATHLAVSEGVRVYSIGIGSPGPVPVPVRLPSGSTRMRMKDYGLDEEPLRSLAEATGGRYFRASDPNALERVFGEVDALEPKPARAWRVRQTGPWGSAFAAVAAGALAGLLVVSSVLSPTAPVLR
jgi:Ca-activated chloride channel family protein